MDFSSYIDTPRSEYDSNMLMNLNIEGYVLKLSNSKLFFNKRYLIFKRGWIYYHNKKPKESLELNLDTKNKSEPKGYNKI